MSNLWLVMCVIWSICSSRHISSICVADIFRMNWKLCQAKLLPYTSHWKRTETLSCFGGKPTPNCLCKVTQTVFQFVYKLESGERMPNFTNGLKINRPCWLRSESTADSRCCFHYPRLCLVYGLMILSRIWCPTLSSGYTLPWWLLLWYKNKFGGETQPRPYLQLSDACWAPVSCREILEMGHEFLCSLIFILQVWSLNIKYTYDSISKNCGMMVVLHSDWPQWYSHCRLFRGRPSRRRCLSRQTSRRRSPPTADI